MRKGRLVPGLAFFALSVLLVGTMWIVPYLPTNDGPEWVFATHAENHYGDAGTIYREVLTPALQFASRGFTPLYGPFDAWLGWQRGLQVALSLTALLSAWGFVALVRALDEERWPLGFLGFPLALTWELYMGLWAFVVSTAVGILVLAVAVKVRKPTWRGRALLSLLLLVNAVAHVFGAVLTGGAFLLLSLSRAPRGGRAKELGWAILTGLPAAGILLATYLVSRSLTLAPFAHDFGRMTWANAAAVFPRTVAPGPLVRALLVTLAVVLASALAVARATKDETSASDRGLGVAAVLLVLLGAFAPFQIPGWQAFSQRFVPMGALLVLAVVPIERAPTKLRRALPALLFALSALSLLLTYPFHKRLAALCPDAIAGLEAPVTTSGTILPITLAATELPSYDRIHGEVPLLVPLLHMGTLYAAAHGGVPAYSFASTPAVYPFVLRPTTTHRPLPETEHYTKVLNSSEFGSDLTYRLEIENELASFGVFYDEVAVFAGLPSDLALWEERGYITDWQKGSTLLAHFEPCSIDFATPAFASDPPPTFTLSVGKVGLAKDVTVAPTIRASGLAHFKLMPAPCGVVTVRADWPEAANRRCVNANEGGSFVTRITRTGGRIVCEVSR